MVEFFEKSYTCEICGEDTDTPYKADGGVIACKSCFIEQTEQDEQSAIDEFEDNYEYCPYCNGSGEGNYDGSMCSICKGTGEIYVN